MNKDDYIEDDDLDDEIDLSDDDLDDLDDLDDEDNEDLTNEDDEDLNKDDFDFRFLNQQNKHKLEGKHALERDILFTGKIEEKQEEGMETVDYYYNEVVSVETGSQLEFESKNHEEYMISLNLEKDVYELLEEYTDLDFTQNRRKPKREDFNLYFELLLEKLKYKYTKCEIFVALAYYFTDNIFNMYKLLYRKHATSIIVELKNKGFLDNLGKINFV